MSNVGKRYGCPVEVTIEAIGGKWKSTILWWLRQSPKRPSELMQLIPGISQKVLTGQLRQLEADGLVARQTYQETPPRVEYSLTPEGETLRTITELMCDWGKTKLPGFQFGLISLSGLQLLVISDESEIREQLRLELGVLREAQVTMASVATMLEQLRQVQPQVAIVDLETSHEDCSRLLQPIHSPESAGSLSAIALIHPENRSRTFSQGFRVALTKPVEPAELAAAIATLTGRLG